MTVKTKLRNISLAKIDVENQVLPEISTSKPLSCEEIFMHELSHLRNSLPSCTDMLGMTFKLIETFSRKEDVV